MNKEIEYSVQAVGENAKLLRTIEGHTKTVTTVPLALAETLAYQLREIVQHLDSHLYHAAEKADGEICYIRREALSVLDTYAENPPAPYFGPTLEVWQWLSGLGTGLAPASLAVKRAIREEVAELLEDTEDVLVPLVLQSESEEYTVFTILNSWLQAADDETLRAILSDDWLEVGYGDVVHFFAQYDEYLNTVLEEEFIDPSFDQEHVESWVQVHRPSVLAQLDV